MKYFYITGLICAITSCKSVSPEFQKELQLPKTYATNAAQQPIDSLKTGSQDSLPSWKKFYNDIHLRALIDSAFRHNIDLQIMDAKVQQVRAGVTFTRGIRLPELAVGLSSGVRKFGDYTIDGVGNYDTQFSPNINDKQRIPNPVPDYFMGVHSSWEIDLWGKLKNQKVAAVRRFLASEIGRKLAATEVVSEIATHYFFLLTLDEQRLKLQENILLQENAIQIVEAQFETGAATEVAVHLTRSQLLETKKMLVEVEQEIRSFEIKLSTLTGSYPRAIPRNVLSAADSLMAELSLANPEQLLKNRPDIQQAEQLVIASKADLTSARKAFYPTLQLNASMGLQAFRLAVLFEAPASIAYNIAAGMLMPVVNRRALKAQLMESAGKQKEAYLHYEKTILTAYSEVFELIQLNESLKNMLAYKNEELRILDESVNSVRELYASGRSTYLEIITTQAYFLETQMELLDLKCRKAQVQVALYKALGGGL